MTRILLILSIGLLLTGCNKPKVLIIGDSISIGYTKYVKEDIQKKARVYHNFGNAQHTGLGVVKLDEWIEDKDWDIIQLNWGLWDIYQRPSYSEVDGTMEKNNRKITCTLEEYATNLDSIVRALQAKTNAKLIFVTTTYVPKNAGGRFENDALRYNEKAKEIMNKHSVLINDIYEKSIPIHKKYRKGVTDVHYSEAGYEALSKLVSQFLSTELDKMEVEKATP